MKLAERVRLRADFYADELWCRHCQQSRFHPGFLDELQAVRVAFGMPMHPMSGARCAVYNDSPTVGGHAKSLHVFDRAQYAGQQGCIAVDIAAPDGGYRGKLFMTAWLRGWSIGWNAKRGFLHLDRRDWLGLPQTSFDY